jgi:tRNA(adenine34) deaminase
MQEMQDLSLHQYWMDCAIALAEQAGHQGEIPVGAIIIDRHGNLIATGINRKERDHDPTAHAEIVAIRKATKIRQDWHLTDCTIYVTLEPCPMCAGAIVQARFNTLVYGAPDPKTGAIRTVANLPDSATSMHRLKAIAGIREQQCQTLLQSWFQKLRYTKPRPE